MQGLNLVKIAVVSVLLLGMLLGGEQVCEGSTGCLDYGLLGWSVFEFQWQFDPFPALIGRGLLPFSPPNKPPMRG